MSLECSNHRHFANLDDRAYRSRRKDAQSLYAADEGSGWVPRTGSGYDWYSGRVAMGTCRRHYVACWMEFVRGRSNAPSQRAELVCECPRAARAALRSRGTSKALRRKTPIGLTLEPVPGPSARVEPQECGPSRKTHSISQGEGQAERPIPVARLADLTTQQVKNVSAYSR